MSDGTNARCALPGEDRAPGPGQVPSDPEHPGPTAAVMNSASTLPSATLSESATQTVDLGATSASSVDSASQIGIPSDPKETGSPTDVPPAEGETRQIPNSLNDDSLPTNPKAKENSPEGTPAEEDDTNTVPQQGDPSAKSKRPNEEGGPTGPAASGPHYAIYTDWGIEGLPTVADLKGFNRLLLAFWMTDRKLPHRPDLKGKGPVDKAEEWSLLSAAEQISRKAEFNKAGISLMISAFGEAGKNYSLPKITQLIAYFAMSQIKPQL